MLSHVDRFIALSVTAEGWKHWCPPSGESRLSIPGAFLELRTAPVCRKGAPLVQRQHCPRTCQARRQQSAFQRTLFAAWAAGAGTILRCPVARMCRNISGTIHSILMLGLLLWPRASGSRGQRGGPSSPRSVPSLSLERCLVSMSFLFLNSFFKFEVSNDFFLIEV